MEQQPNTPLDPVKVRASLRRLYATGLYRTIAVDGNGRATELFWFLQGRQRCSWGALR